MYKLKQKMEFAAYGIFTAIFFFGCIVSLGAAKPNMEVQEEQSYVARQTFVEPTTTPTEQPIAVRTAMLMATIPDEVEGLEKVYTYYDVPMEDALQEYTQDVCEEYGFDRYDIILAMIERESSFRDWVISPTNDYGLMQINICNHGWLEEELGLTDMLDAEQNIRAGVYIISDLYEKYDDIGLALMAYNCGEGGAKKLWSQGIYSTAYSRAIIAGADYLEVRR